MIAAAWVIWYARRNPAFRSAKAWKQVCCGCELFSHRAELSIMQRNAIEDEVSKSGRGKPTNENDTSPAPAIPHAVATLGGNAVPSKIKQSNLDASEKRR